MTFRVMVLREKICKKQIILISEGFLLSGFVRFRIHIIDFRDLYMGRLFITHDPFMRTFTL